MLTLFAIPKPFRGNIGVIQHNAIQSWKRMCHACEIILFGSDEGTAQIASELGVKHVPDVATNEHGTPLVNDIFEKAQRIASYDVLTYVNADIILMSDFIQAVSDVAHANDKFLMVGRRWDVDIQELWDFDRPEWESGLRNVVLERGELRSQAAIDYFVFSRGLLDAIPPFAIGRTAWDNWLIFRALQHSSLVVDATECVMAVHQNHDYGNYGSAKALWNGGGGGGASESQVYGERVPQLGRRHSPASPRWFAFRLDGGGAPAAPTAAGQPLSRASRADGYWGRLPQTLATGAVGVAVCRKLAEDR